MKWLEIILYAVLGIVIVLTATLTIVKMVRKNKAKKASEAKQAEGVVEKGNVRYTPDAEIVGDNGELNVSYVKQDIILQPRKMVVVDKKGAIKPGKYTVLSAYENEDTFNIRIGLYVKEYKHGQEIVLAEGEEICPTSSTIILR
ncbi:MAG: hypothetical protein IKC11_03260 [Clostridia bacterium]|nr:hypothetical protein [Clostridia bacterium]